MSGISNNTMSIFSRSCGVGMQLEPYKLTTGKPVIVSILFCCASPSGAVAVMPCSGENKSTILNPAFIRAVLESIPVFVVAALLVTSPSCFVFHVGF